MRHVSKIGTFVLLFALIVQPFNSIVYATTVEENDSSVTKSIVSIEDEDIPILEEDIESSNVLYRLKNGSEVKVLQELDKYTYIEYVDENTNELFQGYVHSDYLIDEDDIQNNGDNNPNESEDSDEETIREEKDEPIDNVDDVDDIQNNGDNNPDEFENRDEETIREEKDEPIDNVDDVDKQSGDKNEDEEEGINSSFEDQDDESTKGNVGDDSRIEDNAKDDIDSKAVKEGLNDKGEKEERKNPNSIQDATIAATTLTQTTLNGVALRKPTKVYTKQATDSNVLKSYAQGSILKYKTLSSNWYEATVLVNGKYTIGYININDVENLDNSQTTLKGIGLKSPTNVRQKASTSSKVIKSYAQGTILKYKTFSSDWYEATVLVNGKYTTGYIHKKHVEIPEKNQTTVQGIGLKSPTNVRQKASTSSKVIKSYAQGTILKYKTFTSDWYEATVLVNGKYTTGYIHKKHVEIPEKNQTILQGIGLNSPTNVRQKASTSSKVLKKYAQGTILKYKTYTSNWYEATIYLNGKRTTGYIHTKHVENLLPTQKTLHGRALVKTTNVYLRASKNSKVLKSYKKNSSLKFRTLSNNWYEATVYINGKPTKGYLHAKDVTTGDVTNITKYNYSLKDMVDIQMTRSPKSDGAGKVAATRSEVEYYVNPLNFAAGTKEYFQFLNLRQSAGMSAKEINEKVLYNKGVLKGMGQAFIDASKKYNINEAYLIAHTLHETGNGTSTLAKGVPVDKNGNVVAANKAVHTVYNMYGYGAYDGCAISCGAKYAFEQGWFSPSSAITGGASKVVNSYIERGQDTLYKMRWNPISPGYPQYATHVAWAVIQTNQIYEIYKMINNYTLVFDVPEFKK